MEAQNRLPSAGRECLDLSKESMRRLSHHSSIPTRTSKHCRHHAVRTQTIPSSSSQHLFLLLIFLTCCISLSSAQPTIIYINEELVEGQAQARTAASESLGSALSLSGTILVDQTAPPTPNSHEGEYDLLPGPDDLRKRAETDVNSSSASSSSKISSTSTTKSSSTSIAISPSSSTLAPTSSSGGIVAAEPTGVKPMPIPFDMGFNNNITSNCAAFMTDMLSNTTFQSCQPFSLLLQNSQSFFQASKSLVRITQTLDYSCAADVTVCTSVLSSFATNITKPTSCAADLSTENPIITQALLGLKAYKPLYTASCLRNPSTSAYCFADAITNASNPTDSYIYFLPLNTSLVGGSQPTCDACLQNTMAIFEKASSDRTQALASTYVSAASQINVNCGPQFVNASLAAPIDSAAISNLSLHAHPAGLAALLAVFITWLL
ncbi:hypothetical protein VTL71DRAFT_7884 [Oculimacula yallundae]|uniref:DUF7729 domain-containing protein n=1 Tax=Oculimacula yallundae TaxID=86028 RepID=A0ABR4CXB1_9HELO